MRQVIRSCHLALNPALSAVQGVVPLTLSQARGVLQEARSHLNRQSRKSEQRARFICHLFRHDVRFACFGGAMVEAEAQTRIPLAIIQRNAVHKRVAALKIGTLAEVQVHRKGRKPGLAIRGER